MVKDRSKSGYKVRKNRRRTAYKATLLVFLVLLISIMAVNRLNLMQKDVPVKKDFLQLWASGNFEEVYLHSRDQLSQKPLDYFLLTVHGFSAYELAIAQITNYNTLVYIDNCIWSLRKALLFKEGQSDGRLLYVLGKAYYYKGTGYSDLAIKYLEMAIENGYDEVDIPQYLGLAYISAKDYRSSVVAFTRALNSSFASDTLLLSIAGSYIALGEDDAARAYLMRCLEISMDSQMIFNARLYLGEILFRKGDLIEAEAEYLKVAEESGGNAEAHYRLGELYSLNGETVRARAEWRKAVQIDPAHIPARSRLNI